MHRLIQQIAAINSGNSEAIFRIIQCANTSIDLLSTAASSGPFISGPTLQNYTLTRSIQATNCVQVNGNDLMALRTFHQALRPQAVCLFANRIDCIPDYRDFSPAKIGSHRIMNIFLIFLFLVPKINRHGLMLCHVMPISF